MKIIKTAGWREQEKIQKYKRVLLEIERIIDMAKADPEMAIMEMMNLDIRTKYNILPWDIADYQRMKNISSKGLVRLFEKARIDLIREMKKIKNFEEQEKIIKELEPYQTVPWIREGV